MIPNTDQWKLTGKCDQCRRQSYCGVPCKKHKQRLAAELTLGMDPDTGKHEVYFANPNISFEKVHDEIQDQREKKPD